MAVTTMLVAPLVVLLLFIPGLTPLSQTSTSLLKAQDITQAGQNAKNLILGVTSIPDEAGSTSVVAYTFTKILVPHRTVGNVQAALSPGGGTVTLSAIDLNVTADWSARTSGWLSISLSGTTRVKATNMKLALILSTKADPSGTLTMAVTECKPTVGTVTAEITGLNAIYKSMFGNMFKSKAGEIIGMKMCEYMSGKEVLRKP